MTATPIPRTLMLAAYGDLDVSKLTEKPAGRQPIDTRTIPWNASAGVDAVEPGGDRRARLLGLPADRVREIDLANAEERHRLPARASSKVGLVHDR
jgi:ATP-dependent DNA helicase RecG